MLYDLVQARKGRETVVMTDHLPKVLARMKQLRASQGNGIGSHNDRVKYHTRPAGAGAEKHKQKPHNYNPSGKASGHPRVPRKSKSKR